MAGSRVTGSFRAHERLLELWRKFGTFRATGCKTFSRHEEPGIEWAGRPKVRLFPEELSTCNRKQR